MGIFYDLALLGILLVFVITGLHHGIIRSVIELVGFIASLILSVRLSESFTALIIPLLLKVWPSFPTDRMLDRVLATFLLFAGLELLVHLIASFADHLFRLPILREVNSILGGVFGLVKGVAVILVICTITSIAVPSGQNIQSVWKDIENSKIFQFAEEKNPVNSLFQADIWNGVYGDAEQKQKL